MIRSTSTLTLSAADAIANAVIAASQNLRKPAPVAVTVLDASGSVLVQKRMDECPASGAYHSFSHAKAKTCIHLGYSSRTFREKYTGGVIDPSKFTQAASMVTVMHGELVPVAGGILVRSADGSVVGAVGVSGAAADEDEYLAIEGVRVACNSMSTGDSSVLLITEPPTHRCTTLKEGK